MAETDATADEASAVETATPTTATPAETAPVESTSTGAETPEADAATSAAEAVEVDYSALTLPEGLEANEAFDAFKAFAGENGMTAEAAQKLVDMHGGTLKAALEAQGKAAIDAFTAQQAAWKKEIDEHPTLGGSHKAETQRLVAKALAAHGKPEMAAKLDEIGIGDFPPLVELLASVGKLADEDTMEVAGAAASVDPLRQRYRNSPELFTEH